MAQKKTHTSPTKLSEPDYQALVIGTGFGGMGAAIQLKQLGFDSLLMLDRNDDLGGTWHVNSYPGLAVDIPSSTYAYSFEPNPWWSRLYAPGAELKRYSTHVAEKYDLRRHMRFNATVEKSVFDEANQCWRVHLLGGEVISTRILVTATGFLSQPKQPDIPGIEQFQGKVIHTAAWDHGYSLVGKRAAVIGTGATAVQLIPEIAPQLAQLDVYQRTPIWVTPKFDAEVPAAIQKLFARLPFTQRSARIAGSAVLEAIMVTGVLQNQRLPMLTRSMERVCKAHLASQIADPALQEKLTPRYRFGCKRPTFSNSYYPSFNRPNVALVTDGIERIEADAIVAKDGSRRPIDTLILATGFSLWEENFPAIQVIGREAQDLGKSWRAARFESYEGITVAGFPNLFCLNSPYSYNGLSYFTTIEGQMKHMARVLRQLQRTGAKHFEAKGSAQNRFSAAMRARLKHSVFANGNCAGANSYYFNPHGEPTLLRPTSTVSGLRRAGVFPLSDYRFSP